MVIGVIYKYTSPSGKVYIGQTINETKRRQNWFSSKYHYAGTKIDRARAKYGRENFKYEILVKNVYSCKKLAIEDLNRLETYYIGKYDSYNNGYNCTIGGEGVSNWIMPEAQKQHMRDINIGKKLSEETKRKIQLWTKWYWNTPEGKLKASLHSKGKSNPKAIEAMSKNRERAVIQLTMDGKYIREFSSVKEAYKFLGRVGNIYAVCQGKRKSAFGYKWKYK